MSAPAESALTRCVITSLPLVILSEAVAKVARPRQTHPPGWMMDWPGGRAAFIGEWGLDKNAPMHIIWGVTAG